MSIILAFYCRRGEIYRERNSSQRQNIASLYSTTNELAGDGGLWPNNTTFESPQSSDPGDQISGGCCDFFILEIERISPFA